MAAKKGPKKEGSRKKKEAANKKAPLPQELHYRLREGILILSVALAFYVLLSLMTYHHSDPGWSRAATTADIANAGGRVGAYFSDILFSFFGYWAYCLPIMAACAAWLNIKDKAAAEEEGNLHLFTSKWVGFCLIVAAGCALLSLWDAHPANTQIAPGGISGSVLSGLLSSDFNGFGASVILLALFFIGVTLFTGLIWRQFLHRISIKLLAWLKACRQGLWQFFKDMRALKNETKAPLEKINRFRLKGL